MQFNRLKRREFIALLGGAVAAWPFASRAQQPNRVWRVGYLFQGAASSELDFSILEAFRLKLRELGYIEGRNLVLDVRGSEGDSSRLPGLAAELVALRPDVILAAATLAVSAAQRATSSIPIVMGPTADPIGSGFVKSLARPGGNITGVSLMSADLSTKSLDFLTALVPRAGRIAALKSANPVHRVLLDELNAAASRLGVSVLPVTAALGSSLEDAFATMSKAACDALIVLAEPVTPVTARIPEFAANARLPAIYQTTRFVKAGGLLGYGPNIPDLYRRAAIYVDRIMKGANPADLPVEQPTKFDLAINLRAAKALGLSMPDKLLALADEVIE
jgi:putative ABC transport system substrate-binding protein